MYNNAIKNVHNRGGRTVMPTEKPFMKLCFHLFNAITDALWALEKNDPARAAQILISAQQWGEEAYLEISDEDA